MKRMSLKLIALALLMASTWTAQASVAGDAGVGLQSTEWRLTTIGGEPVTAGIPMIRLSSDGGLAGSTGCNMVKSTYALDGSSLSFGPIGTTRKYCRAVRETERAFLAVLAEARGFAIDGGTLILTGGNGETLAAFRAADE